MRYILSVLIGIAITVVSISLITGSVYVLTQTGTCASSSIYETVAPECPEGTAGVILRLMGGIFGIVIGIVIFGARGVPGGAPMSTGGLPRGAGGTVGLAGATWSMTWIGIAGAIWYSANGPNGLMPEGGESVITILTVVFGAIGVLSLLGVLAAIIIGRRPPVLPSIGDMGGAAAGGGNLADLVRQAQEIARQQRAGGGSGGGEEFDDGSERR
jgi:hypothetical protein